MRKVTGRMGRLGIFGGGRNSLAAMNPAALSGLANSPTIYGSKKKGSRAQQKKKDRKKDKRKKRRK
jgi:hypothetical protein